MKIEEKINFWKYFYSDKRGFVVGLLPLVLKYFVKIRGVKDMFILEIIQRIKDNLTGLSEVLQEIELETEFANFSNIQIYIIRILQLAPNGKIIISGVNIEGGNLQRAGGEAGREKAPPKIHSKQVVIKKQFQGTQMQLLVKVAQSLLDYLIRN